MANLQYNTIAMLVKDKLHKLIDGITDERVLNSYLELISSLNAQKEGTLLASLTSEQKNELDLSYDESMDPNNLIDHEVVKLKHKKWL